MRGGNISHNFGKTKSCKRVFFSFCKGDLGNNSIFSLKSLLCWHEFCLNEYFNSEFSGTWPRINRLALQKYNLWWEFLFFTFRDSVKTFSKKQRTSCVFVCLMFFLLFFWVNALGARNYILAKEIIFFFSRGYLQEHLRLGKNFFDLNTLLFSITETVTQLTNS